MSKSGFEIDRAALMAAQIERLKRNSGGMEPIPKGFAPCQHPEHVPPSHLSIPAGMQYRHVCPVCGDQQVIRPVQVWL